MEKGPIMQIQQLRYLIAVAEAGSFRAAAAKLYISQSSVSVAVRDLERETGVTVFERTTRGTTLTAEGVELLNYARDVVERVDLMERRFSRRDGEQRARLVVSSQHYSIVVEAFGDFIAARNDEACEFSLRESHTDIIIRDVQEMRSDLGIIYLSNYNDRVIGRILDEAGIQFAPLYTATPHALVGKGHPLAAASAVKMEDLAPYYRFEQEQGMESSTFFAEEPLVAVPCSKRIVISDNGTLSTLLSRCDGYALGTGAFRPEGDVISIPIETDEVMNVGFIQRASVQQGELARMFLRFLSQRILAFEGPIEPTDAARELAE